MAEKIHEAANGGLTDVDALASADGVAITLTAGDDMTSVHLDFAAARRLGAWLIAQAEGKGGREPGAATTAAGLTSSA